MRRSVHILAALVVLSLLPGVREAFEQLAHHVSSGHGAHAADHPEGAEPSDEDGCAGAMHACHCCRVPALIASSIDAAPSLETRPSGGTSVKLAAGFGPRLFRPPLA